ncbi:amidohydrolase family protein [Corynebacterium sp.]|uniref:amidohydrolase family protein n=1 Tax=Corynebacterium sp. TaxID=1720 RepID=UPI0026DD3003|nr:amidohydrolase family protein [Corynebacterium sp.]MDO5032561.1 amidohydrolase family protein [Corynebacterium sp.]
MDAIDTHAHVYPAAYLDMLEEAGVDPQSTAIARNLRADSTTEDLDNRLHWMDEAGVETQILAVTPQSPVDSTTTTWINDEYARLVEAHPGRFLAYGALPLNDVPAAVNEVPLIAERGFLGVSLPAHYDGVTLADSSLDPLWEALNSHGMMVNIHPTGAGLCSPLITDHHLEWVNGAPMEDATAALHLLKADVPGRFERLRFHIAHLGGDLAFLFQRIEDNYTDWEAFPSSPQRALRRMYFDAANFHEPALRLAMESYGNTQVFAGSDFPYFQEDKYVRAFNYIRTSRLSPLQKEQVLHDNARAALGI